MSDELTDKQRVFVHEYLKDWNATRAAAAAGYSEATSRQQGSRLLSNVVIKKYIQEAQEDIQKVAGVSALGNISELQKMLRNPDTSERDKIKIIEVINKMLGYNAPDKSNIVVEDKTPKTKEELEKELQQLRNKRKKK